MAVSIRVQEQLGRQMQDALLALQSLKMPMDVVGQEVLSQTLERITGEQKSPDGTPWVAWSDSYRQYQAKKQSGGAFLDASGQLIDSLNYEAAANEVLIGTNLVYAATHQFGDDERNIPARPYLGLSKQNELDLVKAIEHAIALQMKAKGLA
ncbi:MAG: phage virion morphogenesis protein [Vibrio sp.]